jgi:GntR family transcriptional regulator/MocR family aminotransferase
MLRLTSYRSNDEIVERAAIRGVGITSAEHYYLGAGGRGEFVLGYGDLPESAIDEGVRRLAEALAP